MFLHGSSTIETLLQMMAPCHQKPLINTIARKKERGPGYKAFTPSLWLEVTDYPPKQKIDAK